MVVEKPLDWWKITRVHMRRPKQAQLKTDTLVAATPTAEVVFNNKKNQSIVATWAVIQGKIVLRGQEKNKNTAAVQLWTTPQNMSLH